MEHRLKALIVDDEEEEGLLIKEILEMDGYQSVTAATGAEALKAFDNQRFDIILSDLRMPGMDGIDFIRQIHEKDPYVASIVFTGYGSQEQVIKAFREGRVNYFLSKPFHADQLYAAVALSIREQQVKRREDEFYRELEQRVKEVTAELEEKNRILEQLSITDNVSGLYNHRHFYTVLGEEVERARRQNRRLALVLMDADGFKAYNDQHGHLAGDRVLQTIGQIIRESIRKNVDKAFRYGGDEFTVVLPEAGLEQARTIAQRILGAASQRAGLTLSVGLVEFEPGHEAQEMVRRADEAMYRSKNLGGNCITTHPV